MSRTNPYKKKPRAANQTLLMYGEGLAEETFLKHLRGLYAYNSGVAVKILNGKGGDATSIVIDAANMPGAFDKRVVVIDNDKGQEEMSKARTEAERRRITLIENSPCLEAMLLSILNNGASFSDRSSSWCKNEFESKHMEKKKRMELSEYTKLFPKSLLESQRLKVLELDVLISCMEEKAQQ